MAQAIRLGLEREGFAVQIAERGRQALEAIGDKEYDVILLDLMLPDMDGSEVLFRIREESNAPVMVLSGLSDTDNKVESLLGGADDYMTKPFERRELAARIRALARRRRTTPGRYIRSGGLAIDIQRHQVEIRGRMVQLTAKEYAVLELLARHKGETLSKADFLEGLYDEEGDTPSERIVDVFICKLRKKLMDADQTINYVQTIWGQGYMLPDLPVQ